jgi:hypothetical protein
MCGSGVVCLYLKPHTHRTHLNYGSYLRYTSQRCRQLVQVAHVVARSTCVLPARIVRCTLVDLPPQLSQRYRSVS